MTNPTPDPHRDRPDDALDVPPSQWLVLAIVCGLVAAYLLLT